MRKTPHKWTEEEVLFLKENYTNCKNDYISKHLSIDKPAVRYKAKQLGLRTNKSVVNALYTVNENFFSEPNIVNSYLAGFILADGYIMPKRNQKGGSVRIKLSNKDSAFLNNIKDLIGFTGPVAEYFYEGKKSSWLTINSDQWVSDLEKNFNITHHDKKNNTNIRPPENLSHLCKLSFICGVLDGDGSISKITPKVGIPYLDLVIVGSKDLIEWIRDYTSLFSTSNAKNICVQGTLHRFKINHRKAYNLLYYLDQQLRDHIGNIRLNRKWNKLDEFKRQYGCPD